MSRLAQDMTLEDDGGVTGYHDVVGSVDGRHLLPRHPFDVCRRLLVGMTGLVDFSRLNRVLKADLVEQGGTSR